MMPRFFSGLLLCGAIFVLMLLGCRARPPEPVRDIVLRAEDGVVLAARLYLPVQENPPGLILAHAPGRDGGVWESFAEMARRRGYLCLALDLRGHGASEYPGDAARDFRRFRTEDWLGVLHDLAAAKQALITHGANPDNLAVAGEDLGANLALLYAARDPGIQAVVLLSPGLNYSGIETEAVLGAMKDCPVLILASEDDAYAAMSASVLKAAAEGFSELHRFPGSAHGIDLIHTSDTAAAQILEWLDSILRKSSMD
jgi:pimeloyl-ACP methyl ester carboxylesterase